MGPTVRTIIPAVLIARPFASFIGNGSRNQPSAVRKSGLRVQRRALPGMTKAWCSGWVYACTVRSRFS